MFKLTEEDKKEIIRHCLLLLEYGWEYEDVRRLVGQKDFEIFQDFYFDCVEEGE
jgi:hypothetical protein|tara:strand:+ start:1495 stop:1656 length:162 start_codon:yes stop_codon:yes gene_type:complete